MLMACGCNVHVDTTPQLDLYRMIDYMNMPSILVFVAVL